MIIIIMYIYHALINALSAHMIHINLNTIFYTHIEDSATKTVWTRERERSKSESWEKRVGGREEGEEEMEGREGKVRDVERETEGEN